MTDELGSSAISPLQLRGRQHILWIAAVALVYFGVARFSLSFIFQPEGIAAIWPPAGIFLSAILLSPRHIRPYLVATLFFTDLIAEMLAGTRLPLSAIYAGALAGDAAFGAWLLQRVVREPLTFRKSRHVLGFLLLVILLSNGSMSVVAAAAASIYLQTPFGSAWLWWWSSDAVGNLIVTPLVMSLAISVRTRLKDIKTSQIVEGGVLSIFLVVLMVLPSNYALTQLWDDSWFILLLNILVFPLLIWAAFRFGVLGSAMTSAVLALVILKYAITGAFAHFDVRSNLEAIIFTQLYIAIISIPSLILAVATIERREAEERSRESEQRFRTLADASFEGIALSRQGVLKDANEQLAQMLGYRREDLLQTPALNYVAPEHRDLVSTFMASGRSEPYEHLALRKDGTTFPVEIRVRSTRMDDQLTRVTAIRDMTERKQAENELRTLARKDEEALRVARMGHWEFDVATGLFTFNDQYYTLHGMATAEAGGYQMSAAEFAGKYVHPADGHLVGEAIRQAMETTDPNFQLRTEARILHADGEARHVQVWFRCTKDPQGRTVKLYGVNQDITQRKRAEEKVKVLYNRLNLATSAAHLGIWDWDIIRDELIWDDQMYELYGLKPEDFGGAYQAWLAGVHPADRDLCHQAIQQALRGEKEYDIEFRVLWPSGETRFIKAHGRITRDAAGKPLHMIGVNYDISERKWAEEAVRERNNYIETLLENAPIGFAVNTINDGKGVFVGSKFDEIYGVPRGAMNTVDEYFEKVYLEPVFREQMRERMLTDMASGDAARMRWENIPITTISGEHKVVTAINIPLLDRNLMVSTVQDVTERWRAEEALRRSEEEYRQLFHNNPNPMWVFDIETLAFLAVNEAAIEHYGYTREEFLNMTIRAIHPGEALPALEQVLAQLPDGLDRARIWRHRKKDGTLIDVEVTAHWTEFGGRRARLVLVNDITERRRAEQLLQALNAAALAMQRALTPQETFIAAADELKKIGFNCAIFDADPARRRLFLKYNNLPAPLIQQAEALLQVRQEDFSMPVEPSTGIGKAVWDRQSSFIENLGDDLRQHFPEPLNRLSEPLTRILAIPKLIVAPLVADDLVVGVCFVLSSNLHASDVPAITAFAHQMAAAWRKAQLLEQAHQEVAARKQAEAEVRHLNVELEQRVVERTAQLQAANKELEAFSYSVSHDLRAPLRAIEGYTRILLEEHAAALSAEGDRVCGVIRANTRRMGELIDDLLSFSRLGRTAMQYTVIEMEPMVRSVYNELTTPADRERIDFQVAALPAATGDRGLIRQMWVNLLSNTIKFSSKRERAIIQVGCRNEAGETVYTVADNGAGFNPQYAHKLFAVFQRLHSEREFEGTGVGLAIVQQVVQRHGGRVWANSAVGQGATFYFTLPRKGA